MARWYLRIAGYDTAILPGSEDSCSTTVVEAYGARLAVSAPDRDLLGRILEGLPRGWQECSPDVHGDAVEWRFAVLRDADGYRIRDGDGRETPCADPELAIWMLRTQMRRYVGYHAHDYVFIHAGVVAHGGRAILLPGRSFAGKSTLVAALVGAGAEFYSDEYAMLDERGLVAQYREPLSLRGEHGHEEMPIGSSTARQPVPVGLVALAVYRPGSVWAPREMTAGEGVVGMMEHAVPARDRPSQTLATLRLALQHAKILEGERGDADVTARALLEALDTL